MVKLTFLALLFSFSSQALAHLNVNECAGHLIEKLTYSAGRAEKICSKARKLGANVSDFSTCMVDINAETKLQPEIIAPYCMKRTDIAFKDCVISTFKSNSNNNAFKSCMRTAPSHVARLRHTEVKSEVKTREVQTVRLSAPARIKISVGYVKSAYDLQD